MKKYALLDKMKRKTCFCEYLNVMFLYFYLKKKMGIDYQITQPCFSNSLQAQFHVTHKPKMIIFIEIFSNDFLVRRIFLLLNEGLFWALKNGRLSSVNPWFCAKMYNYEEMVSKFRLFKYCRLCFMKTDRSDGWSGS